MTLRVRWVWVAGAAALVVLTGCGQVSRREDAAAAVAAGFEDAAGRSDAAAVCGTLAPGTREELEDQEKADCEQALAQVDLPAGGPVRRVDVFGQQARVVLEGDTLLLSVFPDGWKVTAAGCEPRDQRPYQCEIKGA
ncbi:hypothetical protein [Kitasatospora sp. NPDC085879]|uniref:hypothetical protein n=1 Tax=Kitasatospora sp. NPDC085879 TaxID=3154769 RepID=UPI000BD7A190|nr:hypothetical protein [Streptomyces sp. TLI_235]PBC69897.1 hypothetical protein BX265_7265 [Streptomyces sp. TLI_235]